MSHNSLEIILNKIVLTITQQAQSSANEVPKLSYIKGNILVFFIK